MSRSNKASTSPLLAGWQLLRHDFVTRLASVLVGVLAVIYLLPLISAQRRAALFATSAFDPIFLLLILGCCGAGWRNIRDRRERRFRICLSIAFASWLGAVLFGLFYPESENLVTYYLMVETFYALYYAAITLGLELRPDLPEGRFPASRLLRWSGVGALILGLFVYFVLIPVLLNVQAYEEVFPSAYLYLLLDAYLVVRFTSVSRSAETRRWRDVYALLAVAMGLSLINEFQYSVLPAIDREMSWGAVGAIIWNLQWIPFIMACRRLHDSAAETGFVASSRESAGSEARRFVDLREQTLAFSLALPGLHLVLQLLGLLDEAIHPARDLAMFLWLLLIGALALAQQRLLEQSRRGLERETVLLEAEISDRKTLERERGQFLAALESRQGEIEARNTEMERFAYTVSHDLKSPLITIRGFVAALSQNLARGDIGKMRDGVERIEQASGKMWHLLEELLELQRVGRAANEPREVALGDVVQEALAPLALAIVERGVQIDCAPDLPSVWADRTRLIEVLQNLIENAVKYMGTQRQPRIEIGWRAEADDQTYYVRDNGIGIAAADHHKIFELFRRVDHPGTEGTGVGLALVKRLIEAHGGRIWVESEGRDRGSTFCFTLPRPEGPDS